MNPCAAVPSGSPCGAERAAGSPYCEKHAGPMRLDKPTSVAEFMERWRSSAEALVRRDRREPSPSGYDTDLVETLLPLALPIYHWYFRVRVNGLQNVPTEGPAILAANHSGAIPIDGAMLKIAMLQEHGRNPWLLAADLAFKFPGFGRLLRAAGNARASREETLGLLEAGEMIGVFPEGFKGIGKGWKRRYQLQRFGRGGFVEVAFETGVPIIPVAIVGAEETYPMIANMRPLAKRLGLPYLPVTPFFPWLGPLGAVPLPSKWIIAFGEPIPTHHLGAGAAEDMQLVLETAESVRQTIQWMLDEQLARRGHAFL